MSPRPRFPSFSATLADQADALPAILPERLPELALWASGESIWEWHAEGDRHVQQWFSTEDGSAHMVEDTLADFIDSLVPEHRDAFRLTWRMHVTGTSGVLDTAVQRNTGKGVRWIRLRGRAVSFCEDGRACHVVGTVRDITDQREADYSFRLMASAFASSRDALAVLRADWRLIEANAALHALLGDGHPLADQDLRRFLDIPASAREQLDACGYAQAETRLHTAGGRKVPVEIALSRFNAEAGSVSYLVATIRDITDRKRTESELARVSRFDPLTELPNRAALQHHLTQVLPHASLARQLAVLFIDLDGFKEINDSLGHDAGDELLRTMARRLQAALRPQDTLVRWGGDEFVAALEIGAEPERARRIARRVLSELSQRMTIRGHTLSLSGSIGIAIAPSDGSDPDTVLRHADAAMYAAKNAGKNRFALYHSGLAADALRRMTLLAQLRIAVERRKIDFVVQPKFDAQRRITGTELLARWESEGNGVVSPAVFIPLAEQGGLAVALGTLAIERAAEFAARMAAAGHRLPVAVNISPLQVMEGQLDELLARACARYHIKPDQLELEVTESVFLQDFDASEQRLSALREAGYAIAMDDFGTGYSSLGYLRRLPVDMIKIDRSFLIDVNDDEKSRRLLAGVVDLCRALGLRTVAEGVETEAQFNLLQSLGVEQYQGYLLGHPVSVDTLLTQLSA